MASLGDISKIVLQNGNEYDIKDANARSRIEALENYTDYLGVTTTALTDGASTNPITINEESVTAVKGNIVNYGSKEFIFNGTVWQEFGDLSALGALAYENTASGSYTPAGTISGTAVSADNTTSDNVYSITAVGTLPEFTVSGEVLTFAAGTLPTKGDAQSVLTGVGSLTVTDPSFTGTAGTVTVGVSS